MDLGFADSQPSGLLTRWFTPPVLRTPENTRQARSFWMVAWPFLGVVAVVLSISVAVEPATLVRRAVTVAAVAVLVTVLHEINRRGRPVLASWMLVIGLVLIVTQRAWGTGGIHAPVAVFYTMFVVLAGLLLGARAGVATAIVCFAGGMFLTFAELLGWLPAPIGARPAVASLVFVVLSLGLTLVLLNLLMPQAAPREQPRKDLVAMLVRQMQTPIMTLLGHLGRLRRDATGPMVKDVDEAIDGARAVSHLATGLLDVSRLGAVHQLPERRPADIVDVARSVVTTIAGLQPHRDIAVHAVAPVTGRCRPELLHLVLEQLVSNAIAYAPTGQVQVHVSSLPGHVRIAVQDEGPGMPDEVRRRMSEKLGVAALRPSSEHHSTGLGLALCKLSVEASGGTIRIEPAERRGSVVVVELPA